MAALNIEKIDQIIEKLMVNFDFGDKYNNITLYNV